MAVSRLIYLTALSVCGVLYLGWGEWLQWLMLAAVLLLPWVSLILSLPAILRFRAEPGGAESLLMGTPGELCLLGRCPYPVPPFRGRLRLQHLISGEQKLYRPEKGLPTLHCGGYRVTVEKLRICDYLGLFSFPVGHRESKTLVIRPLPQPVAAAGEPGEAGQTWRPKPGGGFSEQYALRPYRPGDSLKQIHWKLSAKTGSLTFRESREPAEKQGILLMNLRGTSGELDRLFGRLSWLGRQWLQAGAALEIRALTGEGLLSLRAETEQELEAAIDRLLCTPAAREGDIRQWELPGQYIGGQADD